MKTQFVRLISFVFFTWLSGHAVQAGLILSVDYEDGTFGHASRTSSGVMTTTAYSSLCCTHSARLVSDPARIGSNAVKMTLLPTDKGYQYGVYTAPYVRAEFEKWNVAHVADIRWYALSVNVDPSYLDTSTDPNGTIVFQWHTNKDACDSTKGPHLSINITQTLEWRVRGQSDAAACTTNTATGRIDWNLGRVVKGTWVDFVVYAKWSYKSDGVLKVWKDGSLVIERYGPNTYNDQTQEFVKWGVYKSWWGIKAPSASDRLIVHLDQIKVGDANSSYTEVAPSTTPANIAAPPLNAPKDLTVR